MSNNHRRHHSRAIEGTVTIRRAVAGDGRTVERLAQLDSAPALGGHLLIGERDGRPVAACEVQSGRVVADPFRPTADVIELLASRARSLRGRIQPSGWRTTGLRVAATSSRRRTGVV